MDELTVSRNVTARLIIVIREARRGRGCERSGKEWPGGEARFLVERISHPPRCYCHLPRSEAILSSYHSFFVYLGFTRENVAKRTETHARATSSSFDRIAL